MDVGLQIGEEHILPLLVRGEPPSFLDCYCLISVGHLKLIPLQFGPLVYPKLLLVSLGEV